MAEARWLSEGEARTWRTFLTMGRALDRGIDRQLLRDAGLSGADYQLLVPLSEAEGNCLRARDLGRLVDWERSRLSHQIARMEQRGLIERRDCPTDARGTIVHLTDSGRTAIEAAAPSHVGWVRSHFVDLLSREELETLLSVSERVIESLERCAPPEPTCDGEGPTEPSAAERARAAVENGATAQLAALS